jgi:hypothetical protein
MKTNTFNKKPLSHFFNASDLLTADSMIPYFKDGHGKYKKIAHLISEDPVYLWNAIYRTGTNALGYKIGLAKCAYGRLIEVIKKDHPQLFLQKENRKSRFQR